MHRNQNPAGLSRIILHILKSNQMPDLGANPAGFAGLQFWLLAQNWKTKFVKKDKYYNLVNLCINDSLLNSCAGGFKDVKKSRSSMALEM